MNNIQIISALTGLVGTVGGVLISYLTLKHSFNQDKHRVKVELGKNLMINVPGVDSEKEQFTIMAASLGNIPFTVANVGMNIGRRSGGLAILQPTGTHQIPVVLNRDQTCNFWTDYEDAIKDIRKLTNRNKIKVRARVSDYAGSIFYSNWVTLRFKETPVSKMIAKTHSLRKATLKLISP